MAECELLATCLFFNDRMKGMDGVANLYKRRYCQGDASECARYLIVKRLGRAAVPADLFPNQAERAKAMIGG